MLMRTRETVDYCHVQPQHEAIHERLVNWAKWVKVRPQGWPTHPMWRKALTSKQWDASPHIPNPVNTLDAVEVEKTVSALPAKHRNAIRWSYVHQNDPAGTARTLGVSKQGLADLVEVGRTMVNNRMK
jgi:DNA-directed RNA polymerase specialized sigma24 family protein